MYSVTKQFKFDSAHRVLGHGGKCRHVHGHSYRAEVTISQSNLNSLDMLIDFSYMKATIGEWINSHWDHNILLHPNDPLLPHLVNTEERMPYAMVRGGNPTAEGMAKELWHIAVDLLKWWPESVHVRIYETDTCWADYSHGD